MKDKLLSAASNVKPGPRFRIQPQPEYTKRAKRAQSADFDRIPRMMAFGVSRRHAFAHARSHVLRRRLAGFFRVCMFVLPGACVTHADVFVEHRGTYINGVTKTETFPVEIPDASREYGISVTAILDTGSGSLRVLDQDGDPVHQHLWGTRQSQERVRLPISRPGTYTMEISTENARGEWRARVVSLPTRASLRWMYASAGLLIALPCASIVALRIWGVPVRYALLGATIFLGGRALWFVGAIILEITARYTLEDSMPYEAFLWLQSVLLGAWQGLAATLAVLGIAAAVRPLRKKSVNALAAGLGSGAFEMFMTGILSLLGLMIMFGTGPKSDKAQFNQAYDMAVTPFLVVADPAILGLGAVCSACATLLIAYGLRMRRIGPVFGGAAIFAAAFTAVSAARTIALFGPESRWTIVAALIPVSAVSYILIRRNLRVWIQSPQQSETAMDAFLRQHEEAQN